ncbi:class I SAM-dependent DNA methyltransferase [Streptomyces sp. NPDC050509]|uniref:class I SAM-dependent DNA methyltransferase n=1 Tax=Streptomyces sp. NPDC050509 TaxID=3365620 RepID=UPI0037A57AC6
MTEPTYLRDTRDGYDKISADYAERFPTMLVDGPLGRAMLTAFAESVQAAGGGPVVEVGSGAGRVTAYLDSLGVRVSGVDLSPAMVALARRDHPELRFEEGSMTALDLPDGSLAGLVAWYSVIHVPPELHPGVFAEFHRVVAPDGHLLVGFQVGDAPLSFTEAWGHAVSLDFHRLSPDRVTDALEKAGFTVGARLVREPSGDEKVPQAYLLARRRA